MLKQKVGSFELYKSVVEYGEGFPNMEVRTEPTVDKIKDRIKEIKTKMMENGTIEALVEFDELTYGIATGYNTIIYYEYDTEDTVGGAVFVNVEPRSVDNGNSYAYFLVVYDEYDGHVEERDTYNEDELNVLVDDLPQILMEVEPEFSQLDQEFHSKF